MGGGFNVRHVMEQKLAVNLNQSFGISVWGRH